MVTAATERKRGQLLELIDRKLAPHLAVRGVVAVGSVSTGNARPNSDIDAFVFMSPLDLYLVPAESVWRPRDDTFHSIFSDDPSLEREGIQFDCHRVDIDRWRDPTFHWPEQVRSQLAGGWIAFDRDGAVGRLVDERTTYSEARRRENLDDALPQIGGGLGEDNRDWDALGPLVASDRLQAVYEQLVCALFAYNRTWRIWRNREMSTLLQLPWVPAGFHDLIMDAANAPVHDHAAYIRRASVLRHIFDQLLQRLVADGLYGEDPTSEAFIRSHDEPGRAWNMNDWNDEHRSRRTRHS